MAYNRKESNVSCANPQGQNRAHRVAWVHKELGRGDKVGRILSAGMDLINPSRLQVFGLSTRDQLVYVTSVRTCCIHDDGWPGL